jgi:hypothetical protein
MATPLQRPKFFLAFISKIGWYGFYGPGAGVVGPEFWGCAWFRRQRDNL